MTDLYPTDDDIISTNNGKFTDAYMYESFRLDELISKRAIIQSL